VIEIVGTHSLSTFAPEPYEFRDQGRKASDSTPIELFAIFSNDRLNKRTVLNLDCLCSTNEEHEPAEDLGKIGRLDLEGKPEARADMCKEGKRKRVDPPPVLNLKTIPTTLPDTRQWQAFRPNLSCRMLLPLTIKPGHSFYSTKRALSRNFVRSNALEFERQANVHMQSILIGVSPGQDLSGDHGTFFAQASLVRDFKNTQWRGTTSGVAWTATHVSIQARLSLRTEACRSHASSPIA
jgi:hypothetical protein